jgi:hypothetical protein
VEAVILILFEFRCPQAVVGSFGVRVAALAEDTSEGLVATQVGEDTQLDLG